MKKCLFFILLFSAKYLFAQNDSLKKMNFSFYGEVYYSYDLSEPQNHEKSNFIYNHKRHNELNVNLLLAKANYNDEKFRGNLGLMLGNYPEYNLSAEPNWAQKIYEANFGIKLSNNKNIWLDLGILPSHIGFESAIGKDNLTLTRSIVAENSPYYETGAKISYTTKSEKLNLAFLVLNGWQKIKKPEGIQKPSFGMQINYKPSEKITLNYSNFLGSDKPDFFKNFRTYHDFYIQYFPSTKLSFNAGLDIGTESQDSITKTWFAPTLIGSYQPSEKSKIAIRGEYFKDKNQILIPTASENGFDVFGVSMNYDYTITENFFWRTELKNYFSRDNIFIKGKYNQSVTTSICVRF